MNIMTKNLPSVMLSVQPRWCVQILDGTKTSEVRKNAPRIKGPFKVYLYCTMGGLPKFVYNELLKKESIYVKHPELINGKVVGEFICDKITKLDRRGSGHNFDYCYLPLNVLGNDDVEPEIAAVKNSCVSKEELHAYAGENESLYVWNISNLVVYDEPKELSEFKTLPCNKPESACENCKHLEVINTPNSYEVNCYREDGVCLTKAPQSWCYVQEVA